MSFETFFGSEKFDLYQTIVPYKGSKKGLFIFRVIAFIVLLYGLVGSFTSAATDPKGWMWLSYFTNESFCGIILYFLLGIIHYYRDSKGTLRGRYNNTVIHTLVHILYNMLFPIAFIVTTVFWFLVLPTLDTSYYNILYNWSSTVIQHLFQFIVMLIDWFLITIPTNYHHFLPMVVAGVAFLIFAQIYYAIYGKWIYDFLDRNANQYWYALYAALITVWVIIGFIFVALQKFKNRNREYASENDRSKSRRGFEMV